MNICIVSQTFPLTPEDSTAHFMYDFASGFTNLGHTVYVLVPFHDKIHPRDFKKIHVIPFRYIYPRSFSKIGYGGTLDNDQHIPWYIFLLSPFFIIAETIALVRLVRQYNIDIINTHWIIPNGISGAITSFITRVPYVITVPGTDAYIAKKIPIAGLLTNIAADRAFALVSNSPALLADIHHVGRVISYGVPVKPGPRILHPGLRIATAGRHVEKKGFDLIRRIVPDIRTYTGLPITVFRKQLLSTDIFIALSTRDRSGNLDDASLTVLEAMAAGCAVITSNLPGYRKIISNGKNGILVNPRNRKKVASAIDMLSISRKLRNAIGKNAKLSIRKKFTPVVTATLYVRVFQEAIQRKA